MAQPEHNCTNPFFSIVIPIFNDWMLLKDCLYSLGAQITPPCFEVILVDDGSEEPAPKSVRNPPYPYPLRVIEQPHNGIPAARNRGVEASKGLILLFVDADCRLRPDCLTRLASTITQSPNQDYFQLRLIGNVSSLVGRAEQLRLATLQSHLLQTDGRIKYLNTAGFAMRHTKADGKAEIFDPLALRAEDTLLLANLMQAGELPLFVRDAVVEHMIPLSLPGCLRKDIQSVYLERRTYRIIASKGVKIRITQMERLRLLWSMWRTASQPSVGRSAWFVVVLRQTLQRAISPLFQYLRGRSGAHLLV
jgi:glycosyltransferase involved in cell wall biosynthesis